MSYTSSNSSKTIYHIPTVGAATMSTVTFTAKATVGMTGLTAGCGVTPLCAGSIHTCAVAGGALKCWGYRGYSELGDGSPETPILTPTLNGLDWL